MWLRTALSSLTPGILHIRGYRERDWSTSGTAQVGLACKGLQVYRLGPGARSPPQSPQLPQAKGDWDRSDWVPPSLQVACSPRRWPVLFQPPSLWPVLPVEARPYGLLGSLPAALELHP